MTWRVDLYPAFAAEFEALDDAVQDEMLAMVQLLKAVGPHLRRPHADTLEGSKHANMK